jgi:hypothetical protein
MFPAPFSVMFLHLVYVAYFAWCAAHRTAPLNTPVRCAVLRD